MTRILEASAIVTDSETASIYELSTLCRNTRGKPGPHINGPRDAHRLMRPLLRNADREHFFAVLLSTKNHVLAVELISVGSLSASIVHPREVFKRAIVRSAAAMLLVHNHPSGDLTPSAEDVELTRRLMSAGELLGIRVLDHLIVGEHRYVSLREQGDLSG
jgi:DNA repair protein RadC